MTYPLGYEEEEINRLKKQFSLLYPSELSQVVKASDHILDVGCGSGDLLAFLPKGIFYTGIDLKDVVREAYKKLPNVSVLEKDLFDWDTNLKFSFINLRLILWSVAAPKLFLQKALNLGLEPLSFFLYEPDDRGLEFSQDLSCISELAKNWQTEVISKKKNPFIGGSLVEMLNDLNISDFEYRESVLLRSGKEEIQTLKEAAGNLVGIFSRYPNSDDLVRECRDRIAKVNDQSWFKEKYCYAYKGH